jgi:hypothetical protein
MAIKSPLASVLFGSSIALFAVCFYLIYRTVHLNQLSTEDMTHTCGVGKVNSYYYDLVEGDVAIVYDVNVEIVGQSDTLAGNSGTCEIAVLCTDGYISDGYYVCPSPPIKPLLIECWTSSDSDTPVCVEPGSDWVGSMIGCIICGVFGIAFVIIGLAVNKSAISGPSSIMVQEANVVYMQQPQPGVPGSQPMVAVVGAPMQVVGTPPPARQVVQAQATVETPVRNSVQII